MKDTSHEDPVGHTFALLRLPDKLMDGDRLPMGRWFDSREEASRHFPNC